MSRVFIVQMPHRWDAERNALVPDKDVSSAEGYGELVFLLTPKAAPFQPEPILRELHEKLIDFSDQDWLLLIGNPALIGFAVCVAAQHNEGRINLLQWSGRGGHQGSYVPIRANTCPRIG